MASRDVTVCVRGPPPRCGPAARPPGAPGLARAPRSIALIAGECALARKARALTTHDDTPISIPDDTPEEFEPLAGRAPVSEDSPLFADLGVTEPIVRALTDVGITRTFAIQEMTLPIALAGSDLIGQARTGTGKTLGFGVPLLQRLGAAAGTRAALALVVVPTRELCIQVARDLQAAGRQLRHPGHRDLRRPGVRAADQRAAQGRRRDRRHPGPAARPGQPGTPAARLGVRARAGRGRRDARPRLPARHRADPRPGPGPAPDHAVLAPPCPARSSRWPAASCASRCTSAPRADEESRVVPDDAAVRLPRARDGQGRDARPDPAGGRTAG